MPKSVYVSWLFAILIMLVATGAVFAQSLPLEPVVAQASGEAQSNIGTFDYHESLVCNLFAAEPMVANPVCLDVDFQGRVFVCESFRQERGVEDNRNHSEWLNDDLAAESVADRIAYMRKHLGKGIERYREQDDRIRLLLDRDQDGRADQQSVFANRFNRVESGTGAGVLSYRDRVYFTCIPDLWSLQDLDGDGRAETRTSLHSGFGVRFAFRGHDMHGLIVGPDGRLYFSIGDRGYNVTPQIKDPASGAVFRCELDGSNLEVIATGLRNPQELAFDDHGNLFTGDNNSDSGDQARWVFVVPGGDSGWRMYYQYLADRGPFNREKIWHPYHVDTPAYIVPPIDNISDGPSGLAFYPGTGLSSHFKDRFFLCDFRGTPGNSGIRTFRNQPQGAFWKVIDEEKSIWKTLATDVHFGPDGRVFVSDWVMGWVGESKGRIYTFYDPDQRETKLVKQTQILLGGAITNLEERPLAQLLSHPDRRVRQEAQFEMVARGLQDRLIQVAREPGSLLGRLHAVWGLGQIARAAPDPGIAEQIKPLLADREVEVRAHATSLLADLNATEKAADVELLLKDPSPRVRYYAAMALARIGSGNQLESIYSLLMENNDQDPIVRHGGIMMMKGIAERWEQGEQKLASLVAHPSYSVRIAACVALRKLRSAEIAAFLQDPDSRVVLEAARATHDLPIPEAGPSLAEKIKEVSFPDALVRRVVNANLRMQSPQSALALAAFAARESAPTERRVEAIEMLANWDQPQPRDRVLGDWRPLPNGDAEDARRALSRYFDNLTSGTNAVATAALAAAGRLRMAQAAPFLESVVKDQAASPDARRSAFVSLKEINAPSFADLVESLIDQHDSLPPSLAAEVLRGFAAINPAAALPMLQQPFEPAVEATAGIQRDSLKTLGQMKDGASAEFLARLIHRAVNNDQVPPEIRLDLILAAANRSEDSLKKLVSDYQQRQIDPENPLTEYQDTLVGGDATRGQQIFVGKTEVSCVRCHKLQVSGGSLVGGEVGPNLASIGREKDRLYLLESILLPNRTIADGFAQTIVMTDEGLTYTGLIVEQSETLLKLLDADGRTIVIEKESIEGQKTGQSSMPADLVQHLSKHELRDLIEFLKQQTAAPPKTDSSHGIDP